MKPVSCQALGLTMIRANSTLRFLWNSAIESCKEQAQVLKESCVFSIFMAFFLLLGRACIDILLVLQSWQTSQYGDGTEGISLLIFMPAPFLV